MSLTLNNKWADNKTGRRRPKRGRGCKTTPKGQCTTVLWHQSPFIIHFKYQLHS